MVTLVTLTARSSTLIEAGEPMMVMPSRKDPAKMDMNRACMTIGNGGGFNSFSFIKDTYEMCRDVCKLFLLLQQTWKCILCSVWEYKQIGAATSTFKKGFERQLSGVGSPFGQRVHDLVKSFE